MGKQVDRNCRCNLREHFMRCDKEAWGTRSRGIRHPQGLIVSRYVTTITELTEQ
jgi:hypothetical protein